MRRSSEMQAASEPAAVAAFAEGGFDLVLMDMQMPVMDGLSATAAIRALEAEERRARTPLIILTANALPDHVEAALSAGADGHLAKPITQARLYEAIEATLERAAARQAAESVRAA